MATVDIKTAALILDRALIEASPVDDEIATIISTVLRGTHKTYRYILVNACKGYQPECGCAKSTKRRW